MKRRFLSFCAAAAIISMAACNNDATTPSSTNDSSNTSNSTANMPTSNTSSGSYAALSADSLRVNTAAGYYLNPKTGKPYKSLTLDESTGSLTDETGAPVWRYVDNRNWWVYGYDEPMDSTSTMGRWNQEGQAQMKDDNIMYQGDGDQWVDYDTKWKADDEAYIKKHKVSDKGNKEKIVTQDGDKIKMKTDEEGNTKIKVNDEKLKVDKDGNVKKN